MDKHFKVFVSSTFTDLKEERDAVLRAILRLRQFPAGMELFSAQTSPPWDVITREIDDSDFYVLIIAGRYGTTAPDEEISYTEKEYDYAVEKGLGILAFLHRNPGEIPFDKTESKVKSRKKLEQFKERVRKHTTEFWSTPQELAQNVSIALSFNMATHPAVGWVRNDTAGSKDLLQTLALVQRRHDALEFENEQLKGILHIANEQPTSESVLSRMTVEMADLLLIVGGKTNCGQIHRQRMLELKTRDGQKNYDIATALVNIGVVHEDSFSIGLIPTTLGWDVLDELRRRALLVLLKTTNRIPTATLRAYLDIDAGELEKAINVELAAEHIYQETVNAHLVTSLTDDGRAYLDSMPHPVPSDNAFVGNLH